MKTSLKILILSCAFGLSGCAVTNTLLQAGYDEKAEDDCASAFIRNPNSIHTPRTCRAISDGIYKPKYPSDADDKDDEEDRDNVE